MTTTSLAGLAAAVLAAAVWLRWGSDLWRCAALAAATARRDGRGARRRADDLAPARAAVRVPRPGPRLWLR